MNTWKKIFLTLLLGLILDAPIRAQTTTTTTTLSAAITDTATNTLTVASATGFTAGTTGMFVDQEFLLITGVSGTTITASRGLGGTIGTHASSARVIVGPLGNGPFIRSRKVGSCTSTDQLYLPQVDITSGMEYDCIGSVWTQVRENGFPGNGLFSLSTGSITPAATSAAIQTVAQTFTLTGVASGDQLLPIAYPAPSSLCPMTEARATAANTVSIYFTVLTAAACTPTAGTYVFLIVR